MVDKLENWESGVTEPTCRELVWQYVSLVDLLAYKDKKTMLLLDHMRLLVKFNVHESQSLY